MRKTKHATNHGHFEFPSASDESPIEIEGNEPLPSATKRYDNEYDLHAIVVALLTHRRLVSNV